jgi:HEPN domain-containing protein
VRLFENQLPEPVSTERKNLFDNLSRLYMEGRYPDIEDNLKFLVTENDAVNFVVQSKEAFEWLMKSIPQPKFTPTDQ